MRTVYREAAGRAPLTVAMTPMIDVVFLLLIFFVCTASFQKPEQALASDLVLSGAGSIDAEVEAEPELEEVVVRGTTSAGATRWAVNEASMASASALASTLAALAQIDPTLPVIVDPDGPTPLGEVISAYDTARRSGFRTVRFAASDE